MRNSDLGIKFFNPTIITDANTAISTGLNGVLKYDSLNGVGVFAYCFCMGMSPVSSLVQIAIGYRMNYESERHIWVRTRYGDEWSDWYKMTLTA